MAAELEAIYLFTGETEKWYNKFILNISLFYKTKKVFK
jgi:hypothetical protein